MNFTVGQFSGPLEKLLELIEAQEMDVSEVSMAKVTDDFLKYLDTLKTGTATIDYGAAGDEAPTADEATTLKLFRGDLRVLADFISIASRLIFLKSKYLLPGLTLTEEEEADIKDLEERLKRYQDLKPALKHLNRLWAERHTSYSRPYFLGRGLGLTADQNVFYPGGNVDAESLHGALGRIFDTIKTYELETDTIKEKIITLEEKITEVLGRIRNEGDVQFKNLSGDKSRSEMIVVFLAVLHLAREQLVFLEQLESFSDILVKKKS